jgi:putative cardiolipin synthase
MNLKPLSAAVAQASKPSLSTQATTVPTQTTSTQTTSTRTTSTQTTSTLTLTAMEPSARARAAIGDVDSIQEALYDYNVLGTPKSAKEAFDTLLTSGAGPARVRRFADDNVGAWNMVLDLIRKAEHSFDASFFTIEKDAYGLAFLGGALHAQLRGVETQILTDWNANARGKGFTSAGLGYDYLQELATAGAKVGVFNTPAKRTASLLRHGPNLGVIGSNHDKAIVIDKGTPKAEGETGGRNIANAYHQDVADNAASWRDDTVQIVGDAATAGIAAGIDREMSGVATKRVKPDFINFNNRARVMLMAYALMEEWVARPALSPADKLLVRANEGAQQKFAERLIDGASIRVQLMVAALPKDKQSLVPTSLSAAEMKQVMGLATEIVKDAELAGSRAAYETMGGFVDGQVKIIDQTGAASAAPGQRYNEMGPNLIHLIHGAQKEIVIQNPYVVLTEPMIVAFEQAAARGVKIKIVTNSPESTDSAITQGFFLNDFPDVLARVPTLEIFVATGDRKFHSKCFTVDGLVSGDTTYNADLLSGRINGEIGAITLSAAFAKDLNDAIAKDLAEPSNGFVQWTIQKDASGKAVLDADGKPIVTRGPKDDISQKMQRMYSPIQMACRAMTFTQTCAPLRHPPLEEALAAAAARNAGLAQG